MSLFLILSQMHFAYQKNSPQNHHVLGSIVFKFYNERKSNDILDIQSRVTQLPGCTAGVECLSLLSSVQPLSRVQLFATPWTAARQASLPITNSQSSLKLMPIESVMPSNHLILCRPLLFPPSIFPSIRFFSNESVLRIRWPK